ncbi:SapB/AmfS family lanthipeptide [Embleya sp. NPDC055664]|uniref:Lanthionine-containing peptide SapB n=1 Tax=Embleya scabrispora TaxID=159449 RepID=A0A1T3NRW3_9ACTN|nr:SapB/AmfS family lanthipeptide [Embleya scabrispora]OPC79494.1 Lanthionine-containing peptide SapB [Embleya scabrispora]
MALLDLQTMAAEETELGGGGHGGGSNVSLLLCGNSSLSLLQCR